MFPKPTQGSLRLNISSNIIYRWRQELEKDEKETFCSQSVMAIHSRYLSYFKVNENAIKWFKA